MCYIRFLSGPKTANIIENVLSYTYAAYVATDLALRLMKEKDRRWVIKEWFRRGLQYTHENLTACLGRRTATDFFFFFFCAVRRSIICWDTEDCYPYIG